jgi:hypothetical protein
MTAPIVPVPVVGRLRAAAGSRLRGVGTSVITAGGAPGRRRETRVPVADALQPLGVGTVAEPVVQPSAPLRSAYRGAAARTTRVSSASLGRPMGLARVASQASAPLTPAAPAAANATAPPPHAGRCAVAPERHRATDPGIPD